MYLEDSINTKDGQQCPSPLQPDRQESRSDIQGVHGLEALPRRDLRCRYGARARRKVQFLQDFRRLRHLLRHDHPNTATTLINNSTTTPTTLKEGRTNKELEVMLQERKSNNVQSQTNGSHTRSTEPTSKPKERQEET